jgi:voltage-gated potassium channel
MTLTLREAARQSGRVIYLEILVLLLSLFSLATLAAELLLPMGADVRQLLNRIDNLVCVVFLVDFFVHFFLAPSKWSFLRWGWIDLLSSIPEVSWLRWGRVFRVVRIVRALRSFREVFEHFAAEPPKGTFMMAGMMTTIAVLSATVAEFAFEQGQPGANIKTGGDALWWAFATITTIGYGDRYPVTSEGKIVAVVLVVFGLSFFGTFTAYVASFFLEKSKMRQESDTQRLLREMRSLREAVDRLETARSAGAVNPSAPATGPANPSATGR